MRFGIAHTAPAHDSGHDLLAAGRRVTARPGCFVQPCDDFDKVIEAAVLVATERLCSI